MLKMFQDLINEHGSSSILRERISLISDKYSILEEKLETSERKVSALEAENTSLKTQLAEKEEKISNLQRMIEESEGDDREQQLDEIQDKILKLIFDTNQPLSKEQISGHLSVEVGLVEYHIDILKEKGLIDPPTLRMGATWGRRGGGGGGAFYPLSQEGRKYVVEVLGV